MKFISIVILTILATKSHAIDCRKKAFSQYWPEDKILKVISCEKTYSEKDFFQDTQLCLYIKESTAARFVKTTYSVTLAKDNSDTPLGLTSIVVDHRGNVVRGGISQDTTGETKLSGLFYPKKWDVEVSVNLEDVNELNLKVEDKLSSINKLKQIATYKCDKI